MPFNNFKNVSLQGGIGLQDKVVLSNDPQYSYQYISNIELENKTFTGKFCRSGNILCAVTSQGINIYKQDGGNFVLVMEIPSVDGIGFGESIELFGHILVVGAPSYQGNKGQVFVFDINVENWSIDNQFILENIDLETSGRFGACVHIQGNIIAIGSPTAELNKGYVTIWEFSPPAKDVKYKGKISNPINQDSKFGSKVQLISNTEIVISSPYEDVSIGSTFTDNGSIWGFTKQGSTWVQTSKIVPTQGQDNLLFGIDFSFGHDKLIVGASGKANGGSAFLYAKNAFSFAPLGEVIIDTSFDPDILASDERGKTVQTLENAFLISSKNGFGKLYIVEIAEDNSIVPSINHTISGSVTSEIQSGISDVTDGFIFNDLNKFSIYLKS